MCFMYHFPTKKQWESNAPSGNQITIKFSIVTGNSFTCIGVFTLTFAAPSCLRAVVYFYTHLHVC